MWYTSSWDRILCAGLQPTNFHSSLRTNNEDKGNMPHEIMAVVKEDICGNISIRIDNSQNLQSDRQ